MTEQSKIPLGGKHGKGKFALVDLEDFDYLNQWKWHLTGLGYIQRTAYINDKPKIKWMHREVVHTPKGMETDHINGNRLDNRKCNLRICSHRENVFNTSGRGGSSKFLGVVWSKKNKTWQVQLRKDRKSIWVGYFTSETEAAKARDTKAVELYGDYARLNFPLYAH